MKEEQLKHRPSHLQLNEMKKIKYLPFLILLLVFSDLCKAQKDTLTNNELYGIRYYQTLGLDGSTYLFSNWCIGSVTLFNGETINNIKMKFDILNNELVFYHDKFKILFKADKNSVQSFTLNYNNNDLFFVKYKGAEINYKLRTDNFIQVLYQGNVQLVVKRTAEISNPNDANYRNKIYPRNFFFVINNNEISEIKLNLKSLTTLYPERKQEIKKLASQIKFKAKSEAEMIRLIQAIDKNNIYNY